MIKSSGETGISINALRKKLHSLPSQLLPL